MFDICAILNADLDLGVPTEDEDIIQNLVNNGIVDEEIEDKLRSMKGFRNIVVHRYGKIDDKIAFTLLNENLNDFFVVIERIEQFLTRNDN